MKKKIVLLLTVFLALGSAVFAEPTLIPNPVPKPAPPSISPDLSLTPAIPPHVTIHNPLIQIMGPQEARLYATFTNTSPDESDTLTRVTTNVTTTNCEFHVPAENDSTKTSIIGAIVIPANTFRALSLKNRFYIKLINPSLDDSSAKVTGVHVTFYFQKEQKKIIIVPVIPAKPK